MNFGSAYIAYRSTFMLFSNRIGFLRLSVFILLLVDYFLFFFSCLRALFFATFENLKYIYIPCRIVSYVTARLRDPNGNV